MPIPIKTWSLVYANCGSEGFYLPLARAYYCYGTAKTGICKLSKNILVSYFIQVVDVFSSQYDMSSRYIFGFGVTLS